MKNSQNITIVLLVLTAAILAAMLLVMHTPTRAYAASPDRRGNYIMLSGQWSNSMDLLYVINIASKKLNVYFYNRNTNNIDLIDNADLAKLFPKVNRGN